MPAENVTRTQALAIPRRRNRNDHPAEPTPNPPPTAPPIAKPAVVPLAPDRAAFEKLADQWERERPRGLDLHFTTEHPPYQQIIKMGEPAVPWLLARLERRPDHWFVALHRITGASPVPPESRGIFEEMTAAWLDWGRRRGYSWQADADLD